MFFCILTFTCHRIYYYYESEICTHKQTHKNFFTFGIITCKILLKQIRPVIFPLQLASSKLDSLNTITCLICVILFVSLCVA